MKQLNNVFKKKGGNYIFIINNFFQLIYFSFILKEFKIKKYLFIIPNYKGYLNDYLFLLRGIDYKIINNVNIRSFPYSILDIFIYKKKIIKELPKNYKTYKVIATTSNNLLNKILLGIFYKNIIYFINTTPDSLIPTNKSLFDKIFDFLSNNKNNFVDKLHFYDLNWENYFIKYKNLFNVDELISISDIKINSNIKNCIFLGQNHKELGLEDEKYSKILSNIKKEYNAIGYDFYVKPHPLDDYNYSYLNTIDKKIPGELLNLILNKDNTILITFFSTTILTINAKEKKIVKFNNNFSNIQKNLIRNLKKGV